MVWNCDRIHIICKLLGAERAPGHAEKPLHLSCVSLFELQMALLLKLAWNAGLMNLAPKIQDIETTQSFRGTIYVLSDKSMLNLETILCKPFVSQIWLENFE
jgi:hypothetical protein